MPAKISPKEALLISNANYNAFGETADALATDPRLSAEERAALHHVRDIAVKRRLRDEHPVLERFITWVEGRGKALSSKEEWQTLKTLLGTELSETEKDAIDILAKKELFTPAIRDAYFQPYREEARNARIDMVKGVGFRSGAGKVSTIVANMAIAVGTSFVFPPALLAVIPAQIFAHRKIDTAIDASKRRTLGEYGVNRIAGAEVDDERRLVLSHLSKNGGLDGTSAASLVDTARSDVALVKNLEQSRGAHPDDESAEAKKLAAAVTDYGKALEKLIAAHEKKPKTAAELRAAIFQARAEALRPEVIRAAIVSTVSASAHSAWPEIELAFADVQQQAVDAAREALAPNGLATQEKRDSLRADAAAFLQVIETIKNIAPDLVNKQLAAFFTEAYTDLPTVLQSDAAKKLKENLSEVATEVASAKKELEAKQKPIGREQAEEIALQVGNLVFGEVLPRFAASLEGKLKITNASKLAGGGWRVEGGFKASWGKTEGSFSVDIAKDGTPDARTIRFTVDEERARNAAEAIAIEYDRIFSGSPYVAVGAVRNQRTKDSDPFDLSGTLADGATRFRVTITAEGLADRTSFSVS